MAHEHHDSCSSCQVTVTSTTQTLTELDFERGIWSAALNGEVDKIQKYLNSGGDPRLIDSSGYTALHYAARSGCREVCQLLLDFGANVNACTRSGNVTPLQRAAYSGHVDVVKLLLKHGAAVCLQDSDGKTSLHKAVEKGQLRIVEILIKTDPSVVDIVDVKKRKAIDLISKCDDNDMYRLLSLK